MIKVKYIKTTIDSRCKSNRREVELITIRQNKYITLPNIGDMVNIFEYVGEVWFLRWFILENKVEILLK